MTAKELHDKLVKNGTVLHGDRILVAREKQSTTSKGGLYIPATARAASSYAAVVLKGLDCTIPVEIGDSIYIPIYGGMVMQQIIGEETYVLEALNKGGVVLTWRKDQNPELQQGALEDEGPTPQDVLPKLGRSHLGRL